MHYVYPEGGNGIYLIVDEKVAANCVLCIKRFMLFYFVVFTCLQGTFRDDNLNEAVNIMKDTGDAGKDQIGRKGGFVGLWNK